MTVSKKTLVTCMLIACSGFAPNAVAQGLEASLPRTMRPVIRGRQAAVSSMKAEATESASRILQTGGNAFDAVVGGQAALAVTDFALNGVGSDAVVLVYDARAKKVLSINAEPRAPKLATIEWYEKNSGGKIPVSDGLLSGGLPGVVDAWYILLDRWGTMSFEQVLQPAIDLAENGFPLSEGRARMIAGTQKILKYPSTIKIYKPNGEAPKAGEIFKNPDLARTLKKLVEAERANKAKGRHEALKAARDRFYKGDIAREMAAFSEANGGLFRYEDFAEYTANVETPVSTNYRGYRVY
jgi:gamma-glutamyltranspeptidase / glutathione hydrolase